MRCYLLQVSTAAMQLKDAAEKHGAYYVLHLTCPGKTISIPYYGRMGSLPIDEMNLSVRSSNALKRCGAMTIGKVAELMETGSLKAIRNLGIKSEKEIIRSFFTLCYANMTASEKLNFWQNVVEDLEVS